MRIRLTFLAPFALCLYACSDSQTDSGTDDGIALTKASAVAAAVNQSVEIEYEISGQSWDGIPVIVVGVDAGDPAPEFEAIAGRISEAEAVRAFDGTLYLAFETQTEPPNPDKDPPFLRATKILAKFDARTGQPVP